MRRLAVAAMVLVAAATGTTATAQTNPAVTLLDLDGQPAKSVAITIGPESAAADAVYVLTANVSTTVSVSISGVGLSVTVNGAPGPADVRLAPNAPTRLVVSATREPVGKTMGTLLILAGGVHRYRVTATKASVADLVVEGVRDATLTLPAPSAAFAADVAIRNNTAVETPVQVVVSALRAPSGRYAPLSATIEGKLADQQAKVPPYGSATLHLGATLDAAGTYTGSVSVISKKRGTPVTLVVTRTNAAAPFVVGAAGRGAAVGRRVSLDFTVRNTSADTVTVTPHLILTTRTAPGNTKDGVALNHVTFTREGKPGPFTISPDESATLRMTVDELDPGEYAGKIRVSAAGSADVDTDVAIVVRHGLCWAIVAIAVGVIFSLAVREVARWWRARLTAQRRFRIASDDLDAVGASVESLDPLERKMLDALGTQLDTLVRRDANEAAVTTFTLKTPLWRRWVLLRREAIAGGWADIVSAVDAIARRVLDDSTASSDMVKAGNDALTEQEKALAGRRITALTEQLAVIRTLVGKAAETLSEDLQTSLTENTTQPLNAAETAIKAVDPIRAAAELERARVAYADIILDDLAVAAADLVPPGPHEAGWVELRRTVDAEVAAGHAAATSDIKLAAATRAQRALIQGVTSRLMVAADALTGADAAAVEAFRDELRKLHRLAARTDLTAARMAYTKALESWRTLSKRRATGSRMGGTSIAAAAGQVDVQLAALTELPDATSPQISTPPRRRLPSLSAISGQQVAIDIAVAFLAGVAAVMVGLQLLYFDNAAWGAGRDIVVAFLWGLGVHQVTGAVNGVTAVRDRITGEPAQ